MKIEGFIFDIDGLMLNSEFINAKAFVETMKHFDCDFEGSLEWYFKHCCGNRRDVIGQKVEKILPENVSFNELGKWFFVRRSELLKNEAAPKKGLFNLLEYLHNEGIKMAIATSGIKDDIYDKLVALGVDMSYFSGIVTGFDIKTSKPHPEIYQVACKKIGTLPQNTIALEDSDLGIESAFAAGLKVIYIPDVKINDPKSTQKAFKKMDSLNDVVTFVKNNKKKCKQKNKNLKVSDFRIF